MIDLITQFIFQSIDLIISILTLAATVGIAFFAYRISSRQLHLQNYQLKYDLYNKRFKYYKKLVDTYPILLTGPTSRSKNKNYKWLKEKAKIEMEFIFDDEIVKLFHKINNKIDQLDKITEGPKEIFDKNKQQNLQKEWKSLYQILLFKIKDELTIRNLK